MHVSCDQVSGDCLYLCLQPLVTCAPIFEGFARKQADCGFLLEDVQRFLATSRISSSSLVEKLHLPSVDCLLDGVKKGRYVCSRKPMLLIAGEMNGCGVHAVCIPGL